ncbi:hypothetical protein PPYR_10576 [Photinus pyralis]|uniref:Vacuolar protein-sorting-associated protein 36 n=1 Tax=Photinus pyralis TaxID=7054 RepID=A0A1Y1LRG2_PHOPY|nr:vacuolar protein-sorting-associated protein 36 [Photinus pyralis]KAB0796515.1 hypothetical protein PPYR_10576 [Photinus pyralis]
MDRIEYASPILLPNESYLAKDRNVRLYDGDQKTSFEGGELILTTHRLMWGRPGAIPLGQVCLTMHLHLVVFVEEDSPNAFSFSRSRKIILHLKEAPPDRNEGPQPSSIYNFIKLSFREGLNSDIVGLLNDCMQKRRWEWGQSQPNVSTKPSLPNIKLRTGIAGIERGIQEKQKQTDENISLAFKDLSKLMSMAKDMVGLSQNISTKIREKQGDITEDETVRFKLYLLSLGIDDPVTRDAYKSDNQYYRSLAKQIADILITPITEAGGIMALTDVFCRVNRARGLELLSPEDLLNACRLMESLDLPLKMYKFDSGVIVLQLVSMSNESIAESTADMLNEKGSLSSEELARLLGISVLLAKERLLTTERFGKSCRDDSSEGLRFYPNLLLSKE